MIKIRTIINLFFLGAVFFCFCAFGQLQVQLRARDSQGYELEQAQAGKPFIVEVQVTGAAGRSIDPQIEGADQFQLRRTGYQFSSSGGTRSLKISYVAQIDSSGSYSLGPATVQDGTQQGQSNVLLLKVDKHEITQSDSMENQQAPNIFVQMNTDQERVVVGQKLEGEIKLYFCVPVSNLLNVKGSPIDGFVLDEKSMQQGVEDVDGRKYNYASWNWHVYPKQSGELILPSCTVDVAVQPEDDYFSHLASFFRAQPQRIRMHSNALNLFVEPLPVHAGAVDAVGRFENFTANINQATAREGDAIVVTLAIEGDADFENLQLELQDVPHVFKSYSSKKKFEPNKKGATSGKKSCEYIVQGMEAGEWEIPEQKFTFYDVSAQRYKTLHTAPLLVKILPQTTAKTFVPPSIDDDSVATAIDTTGHVQETPLKLNVAGRWREIPERKMPFGLFMLLFLAPIGIWLSGIFRDWFRRYVQRKAPQTKWRNAFKVARKKLNLAKKKKDFSALYKLFVELFSIRCSVSYSEVSEQMTKKVLRSSGLSPQKLQEWEKFFAQLSVFIFYKVEKSDADMNLFDQAELWIDQLEDLI